MTKPVLKSILINLKESGKSKFWVNASDVSPKDPVVVVASDGRIWEGNVEHVKGNVARVSVSRKRSDDESARANDKSKKEPFDPGEIIVVDITISNGQQSDPLSGPIAVDDGPEN